MDENVYSKLKNELVEANKISKILFSLKKILCKNDYPFFAKCMKPITHYLQAKKIKELKLKYETLTKKEKRIANRNYYIEQIREHFTIYDNDNILYTRMVELNVFEKKNDNLELEYHYIVGSSTDSIDVDKLKKFLRNGCTRNTNRFTDFCFSFEIEHKKQGNFYKIPKNNYRIEKILLSNEEIHLKFIIKNIEKNDILRLYFYVNLPNEYKSKEITVEYSTKVPYLEILVQRESFYKTEHKNMIPALKSNNNNNLPYIKSSNYFYTSFLWKIPFSMFSIFKKYPLLLTFKE